MNLTFILGVIVGATVSTIFNCVRTSYGTLMIDTSNPEKDLYRIQIDELDTLDKKHRIILDIDRNADLSQK